MVIYARKSARMCVAAGFVLLTGCVSLPDAPLNTAANTAESMPLIHQSRTLRMSTRPGFDIQQYDGLRLGTIQMRVPDTTRVEIDEQAAHEKLRTTLTQRLTPLLTGTVEKGLRMDIELYNVRPVALALNVLSAVALLLPLDSGALTLEASYYDADGTLQAKRVERLSGNVTDIANGFSRFGRLEQALDDWATQCSQWQTCVLVK